MPRARHAVLAGKIPEGHITNRGIHVAPRPNVLTLHSTAADGTFHYDQSPAQYYAQPLTNAYYISPLLIPLLMLGVILLLMKNRPALLLLCGWFAVEYGFLAGVPYENIRFALALVPPLAVCVGLGAAIILTQKGPSYSI